MFNKKGVSFDELRGVLTFMFIVSIGIILFISCGVSNAQREYKELQFSKENIKATIALNSFLESISTSEKKISGIILDSYLSKNYGDFNRLAVENFGDLKDSNRIRAYDYWVLEISDGGGVYNSIQYNLYQTRFCTAGGGSEAYISSMDENLKLIKLKVNLFIAYKCN